MGLEKQSGVPLGEPFSNYTIIGSYFNEAAGFPVLFPLHRRFAFRPVSGELPVQIVGGGG
jgi:hypothetical protein